MTTKIPASTISPEPRIVTRLNKASSGVLGAMRDRISFAMRPFDTETLEKVKIFLRDHDLLEALNRVWHNELDTQIDYNISLFSNKENAALVMRIESATHDSDRWTIFRSLKVVNIDDMSQWEILKSKKWIELIQHINAMKKEQNNVTT